MVLNYFMVHVLSTLSFAEEQVIVSVVFKYFLPIGVMTYATFKMYFIMEEQTITELIGLMIIRIILGLVCFFVSTKTIEYWQFYWQWCAGVTFGLVICDIFRIIMSIFFDIRFKKYKI